MLHKALWAASAAAVLAAAAVSFPAAPQTGELKDKDVKELGKLLAQCFDPKLQGLEEKDKSLTELRKALEKYGKTRNPKDPLQGGLALTADLSKALHQSADHQMKAANRGQVTTTSLEEKNASKEAKADAISYAVWVPKSYHVDRASPLLLCMPGTKDGKVLSAEAFLVDNWVDPSVREKAVIVAVNLPEEVESWTEGTTKNGKPGGVQIMMKTLLDLRERYSIDADRVFVSGRETGVAAALSLGSKFPHLFAGVIGRSGDCGTTPVDNFRDLPTFFAGAGAQAAAFEEKNKAEGYNNCTIKSDGNDADAMAWMTANPRAANPAHVTLYPGRPIPSRAYWLGVVPTDITTVVAKVDGEIDRAKNTITITGTGIRQVTLFLSDALVDLDKPVTLVLNGTKQEALLPRSLDDMLAMMYGGVCEPGRIYVVRKGFDLPSPK